MRPGGAGLQPAALLLFTLTLHAANLVDTVKNGDKASALALINQKVNVNATEPDGTTAITWAARRDDLELADRLIRAGADVKAANRYGVTPLSVACLNGSAPMMPADALASLDIACTFMAIFLRSRRTRDRLPSASERLPPDFC